MPYQLLPGHAPFQGKSRSTPYVGIAVLMMLAGLAYFVYQQQPAALAKPVVPAVTSPSSTGSATAAADLHRDDLVLHLAHARKAIEQALVELEQSQRLTETVARSLAATQMTVQLRRVRAASSATNSALARLRGGMEDLEVAINANKEK